eukprot:TRINITY_DN4681_c0_g1_i1.p1 TRINITY_DN4681_c0_g1~~TRINITY_DN4681_c0_g1_i1.p1  ORF type:complete len:402 (+),score=176.62 TRINITY_DN4681_c0_g1_i1:78-1283(+)
MAIAPAAERAATQYLEELTGKQAGLAADIQQLGDLFKKKYWHELTELLLQLVLKSEWDNADLLLGLHTGFISHFQTRLNLLALGKIVLIITGKIKDHARAVQVLQEVVETLKGQGHPEAVLLLRCEEAIRRVSMSREQSNIDEKRKAKDLIEEADAYLNKRDASSVHVDLRAHIYLAQAAVFKLDMKYDGFYEKCLLYVAHINTETIPLEKQQELAFDLGIAALLGKTVHNFGELIHHPVLDTLKLCSHGWLAELLRHFNVGCIDGYEKIAQDHAAELRQHIGDKNAQFLRQKVQLMALLYHIFVTPVSDRILTFAIIQEKCKLENVDAVEPLLLRALALGLIRGSIDEVNQTAEVTWVASRALGQDEVAGLANHMKAWIKQVNAIHGDTESTLARYEMEA